ncbi:MAG TPA: PhzF family phenazine biosynthesis protein, partial [Isosphaeraceae bacterium]|nr:PhzF family phenazine biosynthesis protein [Isosphaeraceae bacterium]
SETAFLHRVDDGFSLRWFTPAVEVDLCGHATLASAHMLWEDEMIPPDEPARFQTRSGTLSASRGDDGWITLDFPAKPVTRSAQRPEIEALETALGSGLKSAWMSAFDMLVELDSESAVRGLRPDFTRLKRFAVRGIIATSRASTPGYDFVSRFFAPASGIDEDPVTGSAHCCLGPFWADRFDRTEFVAYQASDRGGVVRVTVRGDRVLLGGQAVTVLRGVLATEAGPCLP